MTILLGLIFDGVLAILLIVTIGYCKGLSRRIRLLQDSKGELAGIINQFDQATTRAMTSLGELQTVAKRITEALQLKIDKANFLADDLAFLIEKSSKLALQLEQAKAALPEPPKPKPAAQPYTPSAAKPKPATWPPAPTAPEVSSTSNASIASLEALLSSLSSSTGTTALKTAATPAAPRPLQSQQGPRTDAERELMEALKSGR